MDILPLISSIPFVIFSYTSFFDKATRSLTCSSSAVKASKCSAIVCPTSRRSFSKRFAKDWRVCLTALLVSSISLLRSSCSFLHYILIIFMALDIYLNTFKFFCSVSCFHSDSSSFILSISAPLSRAFARSKLSKADD